ncbi:MAG TPA: sigma-70 family RNA polymerase sigma factor [Thermoanaerobaculia bacterium]|nr:sigma-70 family RNA polymerase sigma factor [Thermoanaerobaculia bacterium]
MAETEVAPRRELEERDGDGSASGQDLGASAGADVRARIAARPTCLCSNDPDVAWSAFLAEFASLLFQVVHLFERDEERAEECFLYVCEQLRRDHLRRLRRFDERGTASFPTWLRAVARNLCIDWRRHRFGRFRLPRSIARLPELEREVFRCVHLRGLTETETLHSIQAVSPTLTRARLADALANIERSLSSRQSWLVLTRWPRFESLRQRSTESGPAADADPTDDRVDLERDAARREEMARLEAGLRCLEPGERLLVRMRFEQGLDFEAIAGLTEHQSASSARRALQLALAKLRERIGVAAGAGVSVKGS